MSTLPFLPVNQLNKFWAYIKRYVNEKIDRLRQDTALKITKSLSGFKFFYLSSGSNQDSIPLEFSNLPGSQDFIFVFGRSSINLGYNYYGTMMMGLITFEDAYESTPQGVPNVFGIHRSTRQMSGEFMVGEFLSEGGNLIQGNRPGFTVTQTNRTLPIYSITCGPNAKLWCITSSSKIII